MLVMMMIMMIRVVIVMMTTMMMIMVPTFASPLSDRQNIFLALVECKLQTRETIFVKITYSWLYRSNTNPGVSLYLVRVWTHFFNSSVNFVCFARFTEKW